MEAKEATTDEELLGFAAVLYEGPISNACDGPAVGRYNRLAFLQNDNIAVVEPKTGTAQSVYRPGSRHNFLFATERCNSACIMCSQPPREVDDSGAAAELLRVVELIPDRPEHIGITGGEPTLLGEGLAAVLEALAHKLPETGVTLLSNARAYADERFVQRLAQIRHPKFVTSVPLYADTASHHDFVVQAKGAFDQTVAGLYNAARHGLALELRVVVHKQTVPLLAGIVEFVYRNLPFVQHIALMGLEEMGFARANMDLLWVEPHSYAAELESAVRSAWLRRIPISVYNLPFCMLPRSLWSFARQSISDYKNVFVPECSACAVKEQCAGLFESSEARYRGALRPIA